MKKTASGRYLPPELTDVQTRNFFRAFNDDDGFTILYELAYSSTPVAVESLSRTFGADPRYISERLQRLQRCGTTERTGQRWAISAWAKLLLQYIEHRLEHSVIEVAEPQSSGSGVSVAHFDGVGAPLCAATYNGLWIAAASHIPVPRPDAHRQTSAGSAGDFLKITSETPDRGKNETRSHDYK